MKKTILRIVLIIMIIFTSTTIFGFSNQDSEKSSGLSGKITKVIANKIPAINKKTQAEREKIEDKMESVIRKIAHYTIYTILGFLIMTLVSTYNLKELDKISISQIAGTIYAITDEIHQSFIPGRSAQITDVMLDSIGVLTGIFISMLIIKIVEKCIEKINE